MAVLAFTRVSRHSYTTVLHTVWPWSGKRFLSVNMPFSNNWGSHFICLALMLQCLVLHLYLLVITDVIDGFCTDTEPNICPEFVKSTHLKSRFFCYEHCYSALKSGLPYLPCTTWKRSVPKHGLSHRWWYSKHPFKTSYYIQYYIQWNRVFLCL